MNIGKTLQTTIKDWGVLAMFVVIISIVLINFKPVTCPTGTYFYKAGNNCCVNEALTGCSGANVSALPTAGAAVDTFVTAFSEPKNWVGLVIIAAIGIALLALFNKIKSK